MKRAHTVLAFGLALLLAMPLALFAGTTGKIAGYVKDKETGQPLPGANVFIEGTKMGAATDADGYYFIINVRPGVYRLTATMMGYQRETVTGVRVSVDLTTKINFELSPTVIDMGKAVEVTAERPLIEPSVTTKRTTVTAEVITNMPVRSVQDIMTLQSGITVMEGYQNKIAGFEARGLDQTHVRGGRSGQIAYMVDGMYVEDAIYAGMGTTVNREAIDELTVITGNFDAEYGEAQSAVVNIVTKEGRDYYSGMAEVTSGEVAGWLGSKSDDLRNAHQVIGSFGGPVPFVKGLSFFLSGSQGYRKYAVLEYDQHTYDPTPLNWLLDHPDDPRYKKIQEQIAAGIITEVTDINKLRNHSTYRYVGDVMRHWATGAWRKAWAWKADWGEDRKPNTKDAGEGDGINELIRWDDTAGWMAFGFNSDYDFAGKLSWRINPSMKLVYTHRQTQRRFRYFDDFWRFAEQGIHIVTDQTEQQGLIWTHQVSPKLFYELRGSRFWKHRRYRVYGPDGHELTAGHSELFRDAFLQTWIERFQQENGRRPTEEEIQARQEQIAREWPVVPQEYPDRTSTGGFACDLTFVRVDTITEHGVQVPRYVYYGYTTQYWTRNFQQSFELSGSLTWQAHRSHQVKIGGEYKTFGFDKNSLLGKLAGGESGGLFFLELQHPYIANPYVEYYHTHPVEIAAFIQDKMEFENLIVNAGIRFDYADSKGRAWANWEDPTSPIQTGRKKWQWSPRLGIGHPITDRATFHFAYGHFFQVPDYRDLYTNQTLNLNSPLPLFGWAHMDAARTEAYELGVDQQIGDNWKLSVAAWAKENNGDPGSYRITGFDPDSLGLYSYSIIHNSDFGSSKGIDISLEKRFSDNYFGTLEYTYSVAKANKYYSWAGYWDGDTEANRPKKEYLMPWDQTHVIDINAGYALGRGQGPKIFGVRPFERTTLQFIFRGSSGYPYTPTVGGQALEPNTARRPWRMTLDGVFRRDFVLFGRLRAALVARVWNILDRKNVLTVYSETGSPTDPGPTMSRTAYSTQYDRPHWYGERRRIDLGLRFEM
ncbi:MAG: TonB-dependent receptor [candidate division KSB1 bacterium]|nr:TonB-dependent receptor [candidate division KSB1 bacterium]MDZ7391958.1 TonB-dependent receptor [candidate division KSB1 bacterium]MDZ7412033.1 TonB-dependent receptor [candidate division KSB1 bacterium]